MHAHGPSSPGKPSAAARGGRLRRVLTPLCALLLVACAGQTPNSGFTTIPTPSAGDVLDAEITIADGRTLYVRCSGSGTPTLLLEAGDGDTNASYGFAERTLAAETRTCVYDRANLGLSGDAPGPRGLDELVGDLEQLLKNAEIPGPYVLVGTSGG